MVSVWKNLLSTVCSVSATLFIRCIPPSSCFHKLKDFISVYKCYFPIVHAHSYFPCPSIHPPKKRNPNPIKQAKWYDPLRSKSKMVQYWSCHLQNFNSWYFSVGYLWLGGDTGHRAEWVGVWLRYQRVLIFCVVAPVFSLKLEGPKFASVRTEQKSCLTFWCYSYSRKRICHSQTNCGGFLIGRLVKR